MIGVTLKFDHYNLTQHAASDLILIKVSHVNLLMENKRRFSQC